MARAVGDLVQQRRIIIRTFGELCFQRAHDYIGAGAIKCAVGFQYFDPAIPFPGIDHVIDFGAGRSVRLRHPCGLLQQPCIAFGVLLRHIGLVDIEYRIIAQQGQQLVSLFLLVGQTGVFLVWHAFSVFLVFGNGVQIPEINRKRFFAFLHVDFFILRLLVG